MTGRNFYTLGETVDVLRTDGETLRQMMAAGTLSAFLEIALEGQVYLADSTLVRDIPPDPYCTWSSNPLCWSNGEPKLYDLLGWFRVYDADSREAAVREMYAQRICVAPSTAAPKLAPFVVDLGERISVRHTWFLASEVDRLANQRAETPKKWPWGDHTSRHLEALADAARNFWSVYEHGQDPPSNPEVSEWLQKTHGISEFVADAMATILRADGAKKGRPRKP